MGDQSTQAPFELDSSALGRLNDNQTTILLDTIDRLRDLEVNEFVDLPQIVVIGDQSSGKSSVLEAISRIRFPARGDVCTRFATELVLRKSDTKELKAEVIEAETYTSRALETPTPGQISLDDILMQAEEDLGRSENGTWQFSKDILRIRISGPDIDSLTLIDLPGLFSSTTSTQSAEDRAIVNELTAHYMQQPKSIILMVVAADQDLAKQITLDRVKKYDPQRVRTIGVITKPDLVPDGTINQKVYIGLAQGREALHNLSLGWYVLRNRGELQQDESSDERDRQEDEFWPTSGWSCIAPHKRGIKSLSKRLSTELLKHIQQALPGVIASIETVLEAKQKSLEQLGSPRISEQELRQYLARIFKRFERLAEDAIEGRYDNEFFPSVDDLKDLNEKGIEDVEGEMLRARKLRAILRRLNGVFYAALIQKGRAQAIELDSNKGASMTTNLPGPLSRGGPYAGLYDRFQDPEKIQESQLVKELEKEALEDQGTEYPGQVSTKAGFRHLKKQVKPWRGIAQCHINQVTKLARSFAEQALVEAVGEADLQTQATMLEAFVDPFFRAKEEILEEKLAELLEPYNKPYGLALDEEFVQHVQVPMWLFHNRKALIINDNAAAADEQRLRLSELGAGLTVRMVDAHFQASLRTFAENIIHLAVERCLVRELPILLDPEKVYGMDETRLRELAGESEETAATRECLTGAVARLKNGLRVCAEARPLTMPARPRVLISLPSAGQQQATPRATPQTTPLASPAPTNSTGQSSTSSFSKSDDLSATTSRSSLPSASPSPATKHRTAAGSNRRHRYKELARSLYNGNESPTPHEEEL